MVNKIIILFVYFLIIVQGFSQKEDYHWILGYEFYPKEGDTLFGNSSMNFNYEPVKIYHETKHRINMAGGNSSLCDAEGNLIVYSNGQVIVNRNNEFIEDTINYDYELPKQCRDWEVNNVGNPNMALAGGLLGNQRILLLPIAQSVQIIYTTINYCDNNIKYRVAFSTIEINETNPEGKIKVRDNVLVYDTLNSYIHAVQHGNGRDWWVISFSDGFKYMLTFLASEDGVVFHDKVTTGHEKRAVGTSGQIAFSSDGKQLALYTTNTLFSKIGGGFCLWDFDRCTGSIQNMRNVINEQHSIANGVAFSGDSKHLYVSNGPLLWQYDTRIQNIIQSQKIVAVFDSFYYEPEGLNPNNIKYHVNFSHLKLGPDGRIYIFPSSGGNQYLSVMHFPHEEASKVDVLQHGIYTPRIFTRTVPNLPEFRLGPDDGSPCDTLGLDNHPIAKFRYDPDTLNYKKIRFTDLSYFRPETWSWDFGDGSPNVTERYPFYTYAQNGTYEVCLTVSNENSSNTTCRTVTIGTSGSEDAGQKADITLFPNPVSDILLVTLGEYIPEKGIIHIYDPTGRKVYSQKLYYGHNHLDLSGLQAGLYFWAAEDGGVVLKSGKVVKI